MDQAPPEPARSNTSDPAEFAVGARLRQLREAKGLSQRALARKAGMTNANLSMIEQGKSSPSVHTLQRILNAFPLSLNEFFDSHFNPYPAIQPAASRKLMQGAGWSFDYWPRPTAASARVTIGLLCIHTGYQAARPDFFFGAEVCGILLEGELCLQLDGSLLDVRVGDMFSFATQRQHAWQNVGDCPALAYCTLTHDA